MIVHGRLPTPNGVFTLTILYSAEPARVELLEGKLSEDMQPLIEAYHTVGIPLNKKK